MNRTPMALKMNATIFLGMESEPQNRDTTGLLASNVEEELYPVWRRRCAAIRMAKVVAGMCL